MDYRSALFAMGAARCRGYVLLALYLLHSYSGISAQTNDGNTAQNEAAQSDPNDPFGNIPDLSLDEGPTSPSNTPEDNVTNSGSAPEQAPSLWRSAVRWSNRLAAEGRFFAGDSLSNKDNRLALRALGSLLAFDLEASLTLLRADSPLLERKRLRLVLNFYGLADYPGEPVEGQTAMLEFGLRQIYGSYFASFGGSSGESELELSAGKQPYSQGVSIYFNPLNYLDDSGSFFEPKNNWQVIAGLSWPRLALRLRYMPVLRFRKDSPLQANLLDAEARDYDAWEYGFAWLESRNRRQLLALETSLFVGQSNWQLVGYVQEKARYNWHKGFYGAAGLSGLVPWNIGRQYFQMYGETLLGNGISKLGQLKEREFQSLRHHAPPPPYLWHNADLDQWQFRGLLGLKWSPLANIDLSLEYRFDSSALSAGQLMRLVRGLETYNIDGDRRQDPRQGLFWQGTLQRGALANPFALTQHVLVSAASVRNIADRLDLQASYFLSLPFGSSSLDLRADLYLWNKSLQVYARSSWYFSGLDAGKQFAGAFGLVPYLGAIELGLQLQR